MTTYRTDAPPVGVWLRIWWWGAGEITAQWDGRRWLDEQGRIVAEPVTHWRQV